MITSSIGSSFSPFSSREHDARLADGKLKTFAPHRLDQDAELQLAAAGDVEGVLVVALGDFQRDVAFRLAQQPVADDAALHLVALLAGERAVVDAKRHGERRRIDRLRRDRLRRPTGRQSVSATLASDSPAMATMSPASPWSIARRSRPRKASTLETRKCLDRLAARATAPSPSARP